MSPTEYPEINHFLSSSLESMQKILADNLVGLYLYGSLVWGDFDEDISDVDLLAVTKTPLNDEEFINLGEMHKDLIRSYKNFDNRLEVAYADLNVLKTFKVQTSEIAVISPGEPFHRKEVGHDWLINWYIVQEQGKVLFGPHPTEVIEPISEEEFIYRVRVQAKEWVDWVINTKGSRPYQGHAILTMCRALYVCRNGQQVSKKQAANWAMKEFPEWAGLIQDALKWREEYRNRDIDHGKTYPQTEQFVEFIARQI